MRISYFGAGRSLARARAALALVACACLLSIAAPWPAVAEDEDTSSQVYLVFDPETGEFITSHDPSAALPTQTGLESSQSNAPHPAGTAGEGDGGNGTKPVFLAAAALVVVLGGAGAAFLRSRRKSR